MKIFCSCENKLPNPFFGTFCENCGNPMERVLHLTIKKEYFDMIKSGIKLSEYREIKIYWIRRLLDKELFESVDNFMAWFKNPPEHITLEHVRIQFTHIHFYNGWATSTKYPNFKIEFKSLEVKEPVPEWSGNMKGLNFSLNLGKIV